MKLAATSVGLMWLKSTRPDEDDDALGAERIHCLLEWFSICKSAIHKRQNDHWEPQA